MTSLQSLGYDVDTYDIDKPPANGGTSNGVVYPQIKYPTFLGVLSHFDAVVYETGDDFTPEDVTNTVPRHMTSPTAQTGSVEMALVGAPRDARAARLRQRGRQADRRRPQRAPAVHEHEHEPLGHRPVHVDAGQAVRLLLPGPTTAATTTSPAPRSCARAASPTTRGRTTSAWSAASPASASPRARRQPPTRPTTTRPSPATRWPAGGLFDGMAPVHDQRGRHGTTRTRRRRQPAAAKRLAERLRNWGPTNEPLRQETRPGRLRPPRSPTRRRAARSSRRVTR